MGGWVTGGHTGSRVCVILPLCRLLSRVLGPREPPLPAGSLPLFTERAIQTVDRDRGCADQLGSGDSTELPSHQQPLNNRHPDLAVRGAAGGHWPLAEEEEHRPGTPFPRTTQGEGESVSSDA